MLTAYHLEQGLGRGLTLRDSSCGIKHFRSADEAIAFLRAGEIDPADVEGSELLMAPQPPVSMGRAIAAEIPAA